MPSLFVCLPMPLLPFVVFCNIKISLGSSLFLLTPGTSMIFVCICVVSLKIINFLVSCAQFSQCCLCFKLFQCDSGPFTPDTDCVVKICVLVKQTVSL